MKTKIIFFLIGVILLIPFITHGDISIGYELDFYFEKNGEPYNEQVDFTITCYGYSWVPSESDDWYKEPGSYRESKVYSFSHFCSSYGCEANTSFSINYRHIDYCDLKGKAEGKTFIIEKYKQGNIYDHA